MSRRAIILLAGFVLAVAAPAFAQVNTGTGASLVIVADPSNPAPGQAVTLTAESPLLDLADSDVEWTVNGISAGSGTSIQVTLGALGSETDASVAVSGPTGSDSAQISLIPTSIDLLWEANTYVPPLYLGRAAPSSGSSIRLWAIPHFVEGGAQIAPSKIDFTWKVNGAVDEAGSGLGKDSEVVPASILYGTDIIEVDAQTEDGALSGEASVSIRTQDPQVVLYEDSPLFGIMYYQAIGSSGKASESETSFDAVPYFADAPSPGDQSLSYAWNVNGSPVAASSSDPDEITIDASSAGVAQISLSLSQPSDPFVSGSGSWAISFTGTAAEGDENSANDAFHSSSQ